jgi:flavin-dependent dehydrogenase
MSGYDAIVIGARVAGSSTAMLLAGAGLRVLAVDRARLPSDTLSTPQLLLPAVARLKRWGLQDGVVAAGTPAARRLSFDPGPVVLRGEVGRLDGADALYGPRRTLLDKLLLDAAREAGAEVRERFAAALPMYDFTTDTASLGRPRIEQELLFAALERDREAGERFLQVLTGAVPVPDYFGPANLRQLIGLRGIAKVMRSRMRRRPLTAASSGG